MDWLEVRLYLDKADLEPVMGILLAQGIDGIVVAVREELERALDDCADQWNYADREKLFKDKKNDHISFYLPDCGDSSEILLRVAECLTDYIPEVFPPRLEIGRVRDEDWENNWKKYYKPLKISDALVIKPGWEDYQKQPGEQVLQMDPGQAFGSGQHETTFMCLEALTRYVREGIKVADIGCGSGILALSALLLGAKAAAAIDIDEKAVAATSENAAKNLLQDKIMVIKGTLADDQGEGYDLIVGNLVYGIIVEILPAVRKKLADQGIAIFSGILKCYEEVMAKGFETSGFKVLEKLYQGEWLAFVVEKAGSMDWEDKS